jgi:hypothetical protein
MFLNCYVVCECCFWLCGDVVFICYVDVYFLSDDVVYDLLCYVLMVLICNFMCIYSFITHKFV